MPNLVLKRGDNALNATSIFQANDNPLGVQTLSDFVGKKNVSLRISGFEGSTKVASLVEAFEAVTLDVVLPALKTDLLSSAALTSKARSFFFPLIYAFLILLKVLPTTGHENNISHVLVTLTNPFNSALSITKVSSTISYQGIPLGSMEQDISFNIAPKSTTTSPELNLNMNFDPAALFTVTRMLALQAGLDVNPLDSIVQLGGYKYFQGLGETEQAGVVAKRQTNMFK